MNNTIPMIPTMLTIRETANRTGISYDAIRKLCLRDEIVYIKAGKKYLINFEKFCEYLNNGQQKECVG